MSDKKTPLELGRIAYMKKIEAGEIKRLNPLEKYLANPNSMRMAINGNCWDCVGQENWVRRVRECEISSCTFHKLRPHK